MTPGGRDPRADGSFRHDRPLPLRCPGLRDARLPVGQGRHRARRRKRARGLAARGAGGAGRGPEAEPHRARRGPEGGRRLGPRRRQVGAGVVDHPVGALDQVGHARHRHRQHRGPAPHQDLARARQVARPARPQGLVHLHRHVAPLVAARPRQGLAGRRHHLVGEQHRGHRRPAQQGSAAPSPCSTRPPPSPTACGRPSRAR